jgi:hypothetical protein
VSPSAQDTVTCWPFRTQFGGVAAADDGRHAEFARDDGGVAGAPAAVGDDGRARFMTGSQSGSVMSVMSTSPGCRLSICSTLAMITRAPRCRSSGRCCALRPAPSPSSFRSKRSMTWPLLLCTVSGRACTM